MTENWPEFDPSLVILDGKNLLQKRKVRLAVTNGIKRAWITESVKDADDAAYYALIRVAGLDAEEITKRQLSWEYLGLRALYAEIIEADRLDL